MFKNLMEEDNFWVVGTGVDCLVHSHCNSLTGSDPLLMRLLWATLSMSFTRNWRLWMFYL